MRGRIATRERKLEGTRDEVKRQQKGLNAMGEDRREPRESKTESTMAS